MRRLVSTSILFTVWVAATRGVSTPTVASCSLTRTTFRGWQAYRLSNGLVKLTVTPDIGGRAIQYELGSHSYFFVNPELAGRVGGAATVDATVATGRTMGATKIGWDRRASIVPTNGLARRITTSTAVPILRQSRRRMRTKSRCALPHPRMTAVASCSLASIILSAAPHESASSIS